MSPPALSRRTRIARSAMVHRVLPGLLVFALVAAAGILLTLHLPEATAPPPPSWSPPPACPLKLPPRAAQLPRAESPLSLETEQQMVLSQGVAEAAMRQAGDTRRLPVVLRDVQVRIPAGTSILQITVEHPTPSSARLLCQAFADAYLADRANSAEQIRQTDLSALNRQIDVLSEQLTEASEQVARASHDADGAYATARQHILVDELGAARASRDHLAAVRVSPGTVLSPAGPPAPRLPLRPLAWAFAVLAGA